MLLVKAFQKILKFLKLVVLLYKFVNLSKFHPFARLDSSFIKNSQFAFISTHPEGGLHSINCKTGALK